MKRVPPGAAKIGHRVALWSLALAFALRPCGARAFAHRPLPECNNVDVVLLRTVDGKRARPGDRFAFRTLYPIHAHLRLIPRGTPGGGFIETLDRARSGGHSGYIVLNAQYLALPGGAHVPVAFAPGSDGRSASLVRAGRTDVPGFFGYAPLVVATSVYNVFHHGKDAALVAGTTFTVLVGDGLASGTCRVTWTH